MPERILIVDDDAGCRALVGEALGQAGYQTVEASSSEEALAAVRRSRPALVILDVNLPGVSGYEICRRLKRDFGHLLPVVFLSGERTESFDRVAGLLLGADDYLVKPFAPDELAARVSGLLARAASARRAAVPRLTRRELQVLQLLGEGLPQAEIASALVISPKTVGTHIEHILGKLGVRSRTQAVALGYREGLIENGRAVST